MEYNKKEMIEEFKGLSSEEQEGIIKQLEIHLFERQQEVTHMSQMNNSDYNQQIREGVQECNILSDMISELKALQKQTAGSENQTQQRSNI